MSLELAQYRGAMRHRDADVDAWAARGPVLRSQIAFWVYLVATVIIAAVSAFLTLGLTEDAAAFMAYSRGVVVPIESVISLIALLVAVIAFFFCLGAARTAAHHFGLADFRYGWGWTIVSSFIPVLFFIRPWFGIAEIHNSLVQTHKQGLQGTQWRDCATAMPTAIFAGVSIVGNLMSSIIHDWMLPSAVDAYETTAMDSASFLSSMSPWLYLDVLVTLSWVGYSLYYLWNIVEAQRELLKRA